MSLQPARDVPLFIRAENASSERRITPSWSIAHLKAKLESVTGIPPSSQRLTLRLPGQDDVAIEAQDEESTQVGSWRLQAYAEIYVIDTRPVSSRPPILNPDSVPKYTMPTSTYETLPSTVLAWKKAHKLGRFDPSAPDIERKKVEEAWKEVEARSLKLKVRCRLLPDSHRCGHVAYIGPVPEIPAGHTKELPWIGIILDEPQGKNDGSVGGTRYFECEPRRGVFVRPDRVEVGDWGVAGFEDEDGSGEGDMEEI